MAIFHVSTSLVAADHVGAHIAPPDGKRRIDDDAELFSFSPSLKGARALSDDEVSLLLRSRIDLMQKPTRPLHSAGMHNNLMFISTEFAALIDGLAPDRHQLIALSDVWFLNATAPSPGRYVAALIIDYAPTVDLVRSSIIRTYLPHLDKTGTLLSAVFPQERIVHADTASGRHIWTDQATGAVFCTDAFRIRAKGLGGRLGLNFGLCHEA